MPRWTETEHIYIYIYRMTQNNECQTVWICAAIFCHVDLSSYPFVHLSFSSSAGAYLFSLVSSFYAFHHWMNLNRIVRNQNLKLNHYQKNKNRNQNQYQSCMNQMKNISVSFSPFSPWESSFVFLLHARQNYHQKEVLSQIFSFYLEIKTITFKHKTRNQMWYTMLPITNEVQLASEPMTNITFHCSNCTNNFIFRSFTTVHNFYKLSRFPITCTHLFNFLQGVHSLHNLAKNNMFPAIRSTVKYLVR